MSYNGFDIYGELLRVGYCSVHPHIKLEYPCPQCRNEQDEKDAQWDAYKEYCIELERDYWESLRAEHEEAIKELGE